MLKDRGYVVSEKKLNQTKEDFIANYNGSRDSLNLLVEKRPVEGEESAAEEA